MDEKTQGEGLLVCAWKRGEPTPNLNRALAKALGEMELALMESTGRVGSEERGGVRLYKYANLASAISAARPALAKHGLAPMQDIETVEDGVVVRTLLLHESGEEREQVLKMPIVQRTAQGYGSAMTYGRRYAFCAMLNIAGEVDDDGKSASEPMQPSQSISSSRRPPPKEPVDPALVVASFAAIGVPASRLADKLGHPPTSISDSEALMLKGYYAEVMKAAKSAPSSVPGVAAPPAAPEQQTLRVEPTEDEKARLEVQRQSEEALAQADKRAAELRLLEESKKTDELLRDEVPVQNELVAAAAKPEQKGLLTFAELKPLLEAAKTKEELKQYVPRCKLLTGADREAAMECYTAQQRRLGNGRR